MEPHTNFGSINHVNNSDAMFNKVLCLQHRQYRKNDLILIQCQKKKHSGSGNTAHLSNLSNTVAKVVAKAILCLTVVAF